MRFFSNSTPITEAQIHEAEQTFGIVLPMPLRQMVLEHNGATWENESGMVDSLISFSKEDACNIYNLYELPEGYMPFADDGAEGCFALSSKDGEGIVHFDSIDDGQTMEIVAKDFNSFLEMLLKERV